MVIWKCNKYFFMNSCSYPGLIEDLHVGGFSAVFRMHLAVNTVGVLGAVPRLDWHLLGDTHGGGEEEGDHQVPEHPDPCHPVTEPVSLRSLVSDWRLWLAGVCIYDLWSVCEWEPDYWPPVTACPSNSWRMNGLCLSLSRALSSARPDTAASARDSWIDILSNVGERKFKPF